MLRTTFAVAALTLALPAGALASTITFDGLGLDDGQQITNEDFSTSDVTVTQGAYSGAMGEVGKDVPRNQFRQVLRFWGEGYLDLENVAYVDPNASVGEFVFTPKPAIPGWIVSIDSFMMSFFDDTDIPATNFGSSPQIVDVAIYEVVGSSWTERWSMTNVALNDSTAPVEFTPGVSSTNQLRLQWALNGDWASEPGAGIDNVGIDNITFSATPIPLPGALPLLLGGIGLLGAVGAARRRRTA